MAVVCREHKLLFIQVPGTGCSIVGRHLRGQLGGEWLPKRDLVRGGKVVVERKHNTIPELLREGVIGEDELNDYLVVASVRNPFDRWVTYYQRYAGEWVEESTENQRRQIEVDRSKFDMDRAEYEKRLSRHERKRRIRRFRMHVIRAVGFNLWMTVTLLRWYRRGAARGEEMPLYARAFPMLEGVDVVMRQEALEEGLNQVLRAARVSTMLRLPRKNVTPGKKPYSEYYWRSTRWLAEYLLGDAAKKFGYDFEGLSENRATIWLSDKRTKERV